MSGLLHPVGPEQPRTYWQRRGLVIVAVLVAIAVAVTLIVNLAGGGDQQQAVPAATQPASTQPPASPTSGTAPSTPATAPAPSKSAKAPATTAAPPKASTSAKPSSAPPATKQPATKMPTPACKASELRATLRGDQKLKVSQKTTFTVTLINGGPTTCVVSVTPSTFELKIYSGTDRIWGTKDCTTSVKPIEKAVASEGEVAWTMAWNGRRSAKDCKNRSETPRPGTYFATAQLKGADPVKLGMTLRG